MRLGCRWRLWSARRWQWPWRCCEERESGDRGMGPKDGSSHGCCVVVWQGRGGASSNPKPFFADAFRRDTSLFTHRDQRAPRCLNVSHCNLRHPSPGAAWPSCSAQHRESCNGSLQHSYGAVRKSIAASHSCCRWSGSWKRCDAPSMSTSRWLGMRESNSCASCDCERREIVTSRQAGNNSTMSWENERLPQAKRAAIVHRYSSVPSRHYNKHAPTHDET